ncbi:uncharacterized protein LOC119272760 [Triticum dicoccoides]|uniref:uncharacterized protein LOC119272760 n=1 Tax=Triticum dicoccoides TaxID=85692 RepID=UPI00188E8716|nr:uncharacterized protein LOC119272760 [Triticum dicoccoides]
MAEPTTADLATMIEALTATVASLQTSVAALQKDKSTSSSSAAGAHDGQHHNDRPPRFQKMDFPKFDGKSDPLAFLNRCESFFHQQRIAEEEKVWMASYNLEGSAQLWYMQVQCDEGTPPWRRFSELLNLRFRPPLRANPLGELMACKRTTSVVDFHRSGLRRSSPGQASYQRHRRFRSSPRDSSHPSASTWKSTTRSPSPSP